jgi:hypothetical protein
VTYYEAEVDEEGSKACCGEPTGPNTPQPGIFGRGGGRTGTVLLSPFIRGGTVNETPYNHYSLLRSVEDLFGLAHLGYAGMAGLKPFGDEVFASAATGAAPSAPARTTPVGRFSVSRSLVAGCRRVRVGRQRHVRLLHRVVAHGHRLIIVPRASARLRVRAGRMVRRRRVRACHAYAVRLPSRASRATIDVRSRRSAQRRHVRLA